MLDVGGGDDARLLGQPPQRRDKATVEPVKEAAAGEQHQQSHETQQRPGLVECVAQHAPLLLRDPGHHQGAERGNQGHEPAEKPAQP